MRDIPFIHVLTQVTQDVAAYTKRTVVIMSAQMGMVAYHLTKDRYGSIYLLDLDGLISPGLHALPSHAESFERKSGDCRQLRGVFSALERDEQSMWCPQAGYHL